MINIFLLEGLLPVLGTFLLGGGKKKPRHVVLIAHLDGVKNILNLVLGSSVTLLRSMNYFCRLHSLKHSTQKPYVCEECGKGFNYISSFQVSYCPFK